MLEFVVLGRGRLFCCEGKDGRDPITREGDEFHLVGGDMARGGDVIPGLDLGGEW